MHRTFFRFFSAGILAIASVMGAVALQAQEYGGPPQGPPHGQGGQSQGQGQGQRQQAQGARSFPRSEPRGDNGHNSLADSVRRVQQREPGVRVLSAERVPFDGRDINRIKYVDERGRVRYMDDAGNNRRRNVPRGEGEETPPPPPARGDNPSQP